MTIGQQYIDLIAEIYGLEESDVADMKANENRYTDALNAYYWEDVKSAINHFFTRKSDKTAPRMAQILAILETWENEKRIDRTEPIPEQATPYSLPKTKIWAIATTFEKMISIMVKCGILEPERKIDPQQSTDFSLIDPQTELPVLNPRQWLLWQVNDAIKARPEIFAPYSHLSFWESLAFCLQNKLIVLRVRDWKQYTERHKKQNNDNPAANLVATWGI